MATFDQSLLDVVSRLGQQANLKIENKLDTIIDLLTQGINKMSVEFDAMAAQVQANSDAVDSALVLINGRRQLQRLLSLLEPIKENNGPLLR